MNYKEELLKIILENFKTVSLENTDYDKELIKSGILDSYDLINLVTQIEKHFLIKFVPGDLIVENFHSITALAKLIEREKSCDNSK